MFWGQGSFNRPGTGPYRDTRSYLNVATFQWMFTKNRTQVPLGNEDKHTFRKGIERSGSGMWDSVRLIHGNARVSLNRRSRMWLAKVVFLRRKLIVVVNSRVPWSQHRRLFYVPPRSLTHSLYLFRSLYK